MKKKIILFLLLIILILCLGSFGLYKLYSANTLPIQSVVINGDLHFINQAKLKRILLPLSQQGFFSVNLKKIQADLSRFPWVSQVEVRRIWPNKIVVNLNTQDPVAMWNKKEALNIYGEVFVPYATTYPSRHLPHFYGPADQTVRILNRYQQMNDMLAPLGLNVVVIKYKPGQFWRVVLNNGTKLRLGQYHVLNRLKRFVKVYKKLFAAHNNAPPKEIDLRYMHGLAVKW